MCDMHTMYKTGTVCLRVSDPYFIFDRHPCTAQSKKHTHTCRRLLPGGQTLKYPQKGEYIQFLYPHISLFIPPLSRRGVVVTCRAIPNLGSIVLISVRNGGVCRSIRRFSSWESTVCPPPPNLCVPYSETYRRLYLSSLRIDNCIEIGSGVYVVPAMHRYANQTSTAFIAKTDRSNRFDRSLVLDFFSMSRLSWRYLLCLSIWTLVM